MGAYWNSEVLENVNASLNEKVCGIFVLVVFGVYMQLIQRNCLLSIILSRD